MSQAQPAIFSQVDVTASAIPTHLDHDIEELDQTELLREVLAAQDRTNEILEELVSVMATQQRQRNQELHNWKRSNPELSRSCHEAAESLGKVQRDYLETLTDEVNYSAEEMRDGEFFLNEFVDRFGPRLAHLNGVIQVLAQLGTEAKTLKGQS